MRQGKFGILWSLWLVTALAVTARAQQGDLRITLGPDKIAANQAFTITIEARNGTIKSYDRFPEIPGLRKAGTSSQSSTQIINGRMSSSHKITMSYFAERQGVITIPDFTITINGQKVQAKGKKLTVGPPVKRQPPPDPFMRDPFEDFFGGRPRQQEFIDIKDEAFLALTSDKKEVYTGEGFTATLAFYVAETNRAPLQFYDLGRQLSDILKKIKPQNCWEENFNIEQISGVPVEINGKRYTQYKIYQAEFYPLNAEDITFPQVGLKMIKYKVAKNPTFFGRNRKEDFKTFYSQPLTVKVKDLPPHPLKDAVAVGHFRLKEKIDRTRLNTGQSFTYEFNLYGEGNIAAVQPPQPVDDPDIEFYKPDINQQIRRSNNQVTGIKTFTYYGIPNEPGTYDLGDYFQWIYFNTRKEQYDTLRAQVVLTVTGESKKNETIIANDLGSFYELIDSEDNQLRAPRNWRLLKTVANGFILLILAVTAFVVFKKS